MLAAFVLVLPALLAARGSTYRHEALGFSVELPDGWVAAEKEDGSARLHVTFTPEDLKDVQLAVRAYAASAVGGPEAVRELAVGTVRGDESCSGLELGTAPAAGAPDAPALFVDKRTDEGTLRVHQRYVTGRGTTFVLQSVARRAAFRKLARTFDEVWSSFELAEATPEEARRETLEALAARCGSQLDWASSWEEAAARARAEHKLVLVTAWLYPGFALSDPTAATTFTDVDVVELVNERYVPYRMTAERDVPFAAHDVYGLGPFTFGSAALLVTPEGEVLEDSQGASYGLLARHVDRHAAYPGPPWTRPDDPLERAALRLRRGELEEAAVELATLEGPRARRLHARLLRRLYRAEDALAELGAAREEADEELRAELLVDEAPLLYRAGRLADGLARLERFLEEHETHARRPEALFWLGTGRLHSAGKAAAEAAWEELVARHPDSPWAWRAAATLTSTAWDAGKHGRLVWPPLDDVAELLPAEREALAPDEAERAAREARAWLLEHQRGDGSWLVPSALAVGPGDPPDDFSLATGALGVLALLEPQLGGEGDEEGHAAVRRALDWLVPAYERAYDAGEEPLFMDYGVWSRAYVLLALAAAVERGALAADEVAPSVAHALEELAAKQKPGGGWSYYVRGDLSSDTASDRSISFTTAAVLLALQAAERAGFDVPRRLVEDGLDDLERTRARRGVFEYFDDPASARGGGPGSAGRGPACALALHRGGRADEDELRAALDAFVAGRRGLAAECGKVLMHTGPDAQGSHYLLFDYAWAAAALDELPRRERARYAEPLLEVLLEARRADGTFVDNPGRGPACGTAQALTALALLVRAPR